jgi:RNA polymerase sigma factor (sigma-70 family)
MKAENTNNNFLRFFSTEYKNLIGYVKKYLNERYYNVSAEDIIQDVALNIFNKVDFDSEVENMAGYFYRSLRNKISDIQHRKKKELLVNDITDQNENTFFELLLANGTDSAKAIDDNSFYNKLYTALKGLNPNQQAVIVATEIDHITFDELSEDWGVPIGTLLSWKSRGMKKLKEKIKIEDFYIENET